MTGTPYTVKQYLAGDFVVSAGSVLFRDHLKNTPSNLQICLIYNTTTKSYQLPKGRKDRGESIEQAAVRETFEETGYECELWPQRMLTRALVPGQNIHDVVQEGDGLVEPIAVTVRDYGEGTGKGTKIIWWYITKVIDDGMQVEGTLLDYETFESVWVDAGSAAERLTLEKEREVVQQALEIVLAKNSQPLEN
ncbi:uncharacterized protein LACBIDRAFT_243804 [Laccaria bicolor S238N-H82]|uniref:Predicted protein n=1 Tax=Laccaria bicolor (strain S238N-H82 / ATCC MYA-4686) TaxID=486041 RepID=B0CNJ4_LACBS|nr:uncharacterized protein LACBIDRAFT_243804 [Laccaria bicolor S238N-H82]EDR15318.1 predicted protein [Laccaria bicolor S238N-H82]|eukprot:XP_001873526.1 predicted protein [Laccaria bicolor S238N-H82]